jgi:hypothetical protein
MTELIEFMTDLLVVVGLTLTATWVAIAFFLIVCYLRGDLIETSIPNESDDRRA